MRVRGKLVPLRCRRKCDDP